MMQAEITENLDFSVRLRGVLEERGMSQARLAEKLGLDKRKGASRVGNWCQGANKPRGAIAKQLSDVLNVDVNWLVYGPEKKEETDIQKSRISVIQQKVLMESQSPYSDRFDSDLILNSEFQPKRPSADLDKIKSHLKPWLEAANVSKDISSHIYTQLKLNLPHSHLDTLLESLDDD